jgi:hypothetical protein
MSPRAADSDDPLIAHQKPMAAPRLSEGRSMKAVIHRTFIAVGYERSRHDALGR